MKRTVALVIVLGLFGACLWAGDAAPKKKVVANIASVYPPEGNIHAGMVKFKEIVEGKTGGRFQITIHPAGAMGGERDIVEGLSNGTIEMGAHGGMDVFLYARDYEIVEELYIIRDLKHLNKFWEVIGPELNDVMIKRKGIMTVGTVPRGSRYVTANVPVKHPDDLKGLKMRLPEHRFIIRYFESLGVTPTVVAFQELYMALKTGVVAAQENPPETIFNYKFYETQKYLVPTSHLYTSNRYCASKKWYDRLDAEDRKLVLDAWKEASAYAVSLVPDPDAFYVNKLVNEKGMILVSDVDKDAFARAAEPIYPEFSKDWLPGIRERIQALQEK